MTREWLEEIKHYWGVWTPEARNEARLALTAALEQAWGERQHLDVHWRSAEARAEKAEARCKEMEKLLADGAMFKPPCFICGYNGPNYYNPQVHPCAARHHGSSCNGQGLDCGPDFRRKRPRKGVIPGTRPDDL